MGAGCCKPAIVEFNPDNVEKETQTGDQAATDDVELRQATKDGDLEQMRMLLRRMPKHQINRGASKKEASESEIGCTALHYAVMENNYQAVQKLILYGANPNCKQANGDTPLHIALSTGKKTIASYLLQREANINQSNKKGTTPFLAAMLSGRKALVSWLRQEDVQGSKIDYTSVDKSGNHATVIAAKYAWFDMLEEILGIVGKTSASEIGKVLNIRTAEGDTTLGWVLKFGCTDQLKPEKQQFLVLKLVEYGASPAVPAFAEKVPTPALAAASGNVQVLDKILEPKDGKAIPATSKDALKRHALHYAAAFGRTEACKKLLETTEVKVNDQDVFGNTPLHLAASRGHEECSKLLLDKTDNASATLLKANKHGLTVYHLALKAGHSAKAQEAAIAILGKLQGDELKLPVLDKKKQVQDTPLLLAIASHQDKVVKALLDKGLDANQANAAGQTPLARCLGGVTHASQHEDAVILDHLLTAGANIDGGSEANHPLLAICKTRSSEFAQKAVSTLKSKGALDWNKKDDREHTPLMLAAHHDNKYLVKYLVEEVKVEVNSKTSYGKTAAMSAAMGGSQAALQYLLNQGADAAAVDQDGNTTLSYCLKLDSVDVLGCAAQLVMMGAAPEPCKDITGETLPHRAVKYGVSDFLDIWTKYGGKLDLNATMDLLADQVPGVESQGGEQSSDPLNADIEPAATVEQDDEEAQDDDPEVQEIMDGLNNTGPVAEGYDGESYLDFCPVVSTKNARQWLVQDDQWWDQWLDNTASEELPPDDQELLDDDLELHDDPLATIDDELILDQLLAQHKKDGSIDPGPVAEGLMSNLNASMSSKVKPVDEADEVVAKANQDAAADGWVKQDKVTKDGAKEEAKDGKEETKDGKEEAKDGKEGAKDEPAGVKKPGEAEKNKDDGLDVYTKGNQKLNAALDEGTEKLLNSGMSNLFNKSIKINDPYYAEGDKMYQGTPKYMLINVDKIADSVLDEHIKTFEARVQALTVTEDEILEAGELRARNIKCWIESMSPEEFPIKRGQWKLLHKKVPDAVKAATKRQPRSAKDKPKARKRTTWFGLPALPDRQEPCETTPLSYAVRLSRAGCVKAILAHIEGMKTLNMADGWGHTPLHYAMFLLAKDKNNVAKQQIVDMLLAARPVLPRSYIPGFGEATKESWLQKSLEAGSVMQPLVLAQLMNDAVRMTYMCRKLAGGVDASWVSISEVPTYLKGLWEKRVPGRMEGQLTPIHLAVMNKNIESVRLCISLAADVNQVGEESATKNTNSIRWEVMKELSKPLKPGQTLPLPRELYAAKLTAAWTKQFAAKVKRLEQMEKNKGKKGAAMMLVKIKDFIMSIEIPGLTRPHPWVTPLHLAARSGLAEVAQFLISNGAVPAGMSPFQKKTPLEEALAYSRSNFLACNLSADRANFKEVRKLMQTCPPMNPACLAAAANEVYTKIFKMMDPTQAPIIAVAMAAKVIVKIVMAMLKRPIVHHDPSMQCAHVLLLARGPVNLAEMQTSIMLRDLMDNGTWEWTKVAGITDDSWTTEAKKQVEELTKDEKCGFDKISAADKPKKYRQLRRQFMHKSDMAYVKNGQEIWYNMYKTEMEAKMKTDQEKAVVAAQEAKTKYVEALQAYTLAVHTTLDAVEGYDKQALENLSAIIKNGVQLEELQYDAMEAYADFASAASDAVFNVLDNGLSDDQVNNLIDGGIEQAADAFGGDDEEEEEEKDGEDKKKKKKGEQSGKDLDGKEGEETGADKEKKGDAAKKGDAGKAEGKGPGVAGKGGKKHKKKRVQHMPKYSKSSAKNNMSEASNVIKNTALNAIQSCVDAAKDAVKEAAVGCAQDALNSNGVDIESIATNAGKIVEQLQSLNDPDSVLGVAMDLITGDTDIGELMEQLEGYKDSLNMVLELVGLELEI